MIHDAPKTPLMPKATAVWLIENSTLSFEQIAAFCHMHLLEIKAISNGEAALGIKGLNPVDMGQISQEDLERCQKDDSLRLTLVGAAQKEHTSGGKGKKGGASRYTPLARRGDRPDAIAWLIKQYPNFSDARIMRLVGTTKPTVESIRKRTHWNMVNIKLRSPVSLGFCTQEELDALALLTSSGELKEQGGKL